jgi:hypothetical protein
MNRVQSLRVVFVFPVLCACAGQQTIHLSTSEPAEIWKDGERVCVQTPCDYTYTRQGCGFPRIMATSRIVFIARTKDGRSGVLGAPDYCDVTDDWFIAVEASSGTATATTP